MKFRLSIFCLVFFLSTGTILGQETSKLSISIEVDKELKDSFNPEGRLFLFLSTSDWGEPRFQTWPIGQNTVFAKNFMDLTIGKSISLNDINDWVKTSDWGLDAVPNGSYKIQVLWDQDNSESRTDAPGNLHSEVSSIDLKTDASVKLVINKVVPPRELVDNKFVKMVEIKSELLSKFWDKAMTVKASVLLPSGYFDNPNAKYPVRYNIAGYGGRYSRVNRLLGDGSDFKEWWFSGNAPQVINVFLDGEGPFGDSYQLDSDNSGPYGESLITELIPFIEKEYRGMADPMYRFVDGCSTGGWVSLALQVYYPDFFNGVWSYSPDAIDFENYQLINIYKDENAYVNEYGFPRPVMRDIYGEPMLSLKDFIQFENVFGPSNTYLNSGGQFSAHTALYSPKGQNGLPAPLMDPETGEIDHQIAEDWKKYDIKLHVQENWPELGPKLQGKIWIWMGDMDNFYLNIATRAFDEYLKTTENPKSDAQITFTAMNSHCQQFDNKAILEMIDEKVKSMKSMK